MHMVRKMLKLEYNDSTNLHVVFPIRREVWSQIFDSTKWPTMLVHTIKGKPCDFEA